MFDELDHSFININKPYDFFEEKMDEMFHAFDQGFTSYVKTWSNAFKISSNIASKIHDRYSPELQQVLSD